MTPIQLESLRSNLFLGEDDEEALDSLEPYQFFNIPEFGIKYVEYVKQLRNLYVNPEKDLLASPEEWSKIALDVPVEEQKDEFTVLASGRHVVRINLHMSSTCSAWLQGLIARFPGMYPGQPDRWNLSTVVVPVLMDIMKDDHDRHRDMGTTRGKDSVVSMRP